MSNNHDTNIGRVMLDMMFDSPMEQIDSLLEQARELIEKYGERNGQETADREGVSVH